MKAIPTLVHAATLAAVALTTRVGFAQLAPEPPPDAKAEGGELTPPSLKSRVDAPYPDEARRLRIEGNVGLELVVGEDGHVLDAKVTGSAGHGFDEAAVDAARSFVFEPARENGKAIKSEVQFTYAFHLPPEAVVPTPPTRPPPTPPTPTPTPPLDATQMGADQSTLVLAQRPISAASSMTVRDRDFRLRPIGSVADILRVTPGLLVVQHSGGGKANQYFLRGFDADHGTDIALSVDGIPINMVSHGHGQGYADTNFIIPEIVERVEITKGPYFAEQGDFSTAGSVNFVTKNDFQHSSIGFGVGGAPAYGAPAYRGLLVASPRLDGTLASVKPLFVADVGRSNGPFANPERFDRYKLFEKVTLGLGSRATLTVGGSSYSGSWFGSGQIPARAVANGSLSRFSTLDPSEGGDSSRHQFFTSIKARPSERSEINVMTYVGLYRLNIVSNFTGFLNDPDNGDQITQKDRRTFAGGRASYRVVDTVGGVRFDTTFGANLRTDSITNALERTRQRELVGRVREARVNETSIGAFAKEEVTPVKWLRFIAGARSDFFSFTVDDALEQPNQAEGGTGGSKGASRLSPKGSVVVTPISRKNVELDLYANYGHGFHSNDARGVVRAVSPVTPLTRAIGYEGGARLRLFDRWDLAAAVWRLDLDSETVWIGDEGSTEESGATKRYGGELETRLALSDWLSADLDLTATKSAFVQSTGNGSAVALAPRYTWAAGLSARHPTGFRAGVRMYGVGDRPATEDEFLTATGFTVFDLHAGYQARRWDIGLDVENLFDAKYRGAQFATTSRLRNEPSTNAPAPNGTCTGGSRAVTNGQNFGGCEDVNFSPGYPFTVRLMTTFYLD
jgi:TonB family protein